MIAQYLTGLSGSKLHWKKQPTPVIHTLPLPATLAMALPPGVKNNQILVQVNEPVLRGQALTVSENFQTPPVHAASSGTVTEIDSSHIKILCDGCDRSVPDTVNQFTPSRDNLAKIAHRAGLVGQGGAGYPVAAKLSTLVSPELLLVNAAECDPLIYCDDALISSRPDTIIQAILDIAAHCNIVNICIGIEDNKPDSIQALKDSLSKCTDKSPSIELVIIPSQYPTGAERHLLAHCSEHIPERDKPLAHSGILSMNVATCDALGQTLLSGAPCTERIVTAVSPDGQIYNFSSRIGTPLQHLYQHLDCAIPLNEIKSISVGGLMMPIAITQSESIGQHTNCIIFDTSGAKPLESVACIRCGACAQVCPEQLMPQHLHTYAVHFDQQKLSDYRLDRCIECRCCDVVCPSQIPLASQFRAAKVRIDKHEQSEVDAMLAKERYEKRVKRLASKNAKEKRRQRKIKTDTNRPELSRKALIDAALNRSIKKKVKRGE